MTASQKELFISIARNGIICGLWHPYEWLVNYLRALDNWCALKEIPAREAEANEAFLAFFKSCSVGEGDPMEQWTVADMTAAINLYFEAPKEIDVLRRIQEMAAKEIEPATPTINPLSDK